MKSKIEIAAALRRLKVIATDFDGVWTDGKVTVDQNGIESVVCSRKDTLLLPLIAEAGIQVVIVSKETNLVVAVRAKKLNVEAYLGAHNKAETLQSILQEKQIPLQDWAFVGDDINDIPCLTLVGLAVTVADGHPKCKEIADVVLTRRGGDHAVREFFEMVLDNQK